MTTGLDPEPADPTPPVTSGWIQPGPSARPSRRGPILALGCLGVVVLFVGLVVGVPLVAVAILDASAGAPAMQSIGFGTGGSGCVLDVTTHTFASGTPVRIVAQFTPELAAGTTVTIKVAKDGGSLEDRGVVNVDTPSDCIGGAMTPLGPGHYHVELDVSQSSMPAITGDFVVET
jgi:hypothetical protein